MIEGFIHIPLNKTWILLIVTFKIIINKSFDTIFMKNIKIRSKINRFFFFQKILMWNIYNSNETFL